MSKGRGPICTKGGLPTANCVSTFTFVVHFTANCVNTCMKQVSTRDFQLKLNDYLSELPVELTRYGKVVAIVTSPVLTGKSMAEIIEPLLEEEAAVEGVLPAVITQRVKNMDFRLCPCGTRKDTCRKHMFSK